MAVYEVMSALYFVWNGGAKLSKAILDEIKEEPSHNTNNIYKRRLSTQDTIEEYYNRSKKVWKVTQPYRIASEYLKSFVAICAWVFWTFFISMEGEKPRIYLIITYHSCFKFLTFMVMQKNSSLEDDAKEGFGEGKHVIIHVWLLSCVSMFTVSYPYGTFNAYESIVPVVLILSSFLACSMASDSYKGSLEYFRVSGSEMMYKLLYKEAPDIMLKVGLT